MKVDVAALRLINCSGVSSLIGVKCRVFVAVFFFELSNKFLVILDNRQQQSQNNYLNLNPQYWYKVGENS
jgi:hypothetical protein